MKMGTKFWVDHVAAAKRETISASAYAKRHGISVAALYYWQHKLKTPPVVTHSDKARKFVAVRVTDVVAAQCPPGCTLILSSGMRLEMSVLPTPQWLAALSHATQGAN